MPNYPMHNIEYAQRSLQQLVLDRDLSIISEDAYTILRKKIELRIRMLKRNEMLSSAAKLKMARQTS